MCCVVKRLDGEFGQKETLPIYHSGGIVVTTAELTRTVCLNQTDAQVPVCTDGSVYISHTTVEMGQGVNNKVMQVEEQVLGVDIGDCHITECNNDQVDNTRSTTASMGADLNA